MIDEMIDKKENKHIVPYGLFIAVWVGLIVLTVITIYVAGLELGNLSTFTAMIIATVKASLVLWFFMHLKYEKPVFKIMMLVTIATFTVIMLMIFTDIWFR